MSRLRIHDGFDAAKKRRRKQVVGVERKHQRRVCRFKSGVARRAKAAIDGVAQQPDALIAKGRDD